MKKSRIIILLTLLVLMIVAGYFFLFRKNIEVIYAKQGDIVELNFEFDKKVEFGEYYFNINNGKASTYPLCFCLTEKNTYPPDCSGDVKYLYKNAPGTLCVPLKIGNGRCSVAPIKTLGYATNFMIPLEYSWTKPFQKIGLGIKVPEQAPNNALLVVEITIFKQAATGKLEPYRIYQKMIRVVHSKSNQ